MAIILSRCFSPQDGAGKHAAQSSHESQHSGWQRRHHRQLVVGSPGGRRSSSRYQQAPRRLLYHCTCKLPACSCGHSGSNSHRSTTKNPSARQLPDDCEPGP